MVESKDLAAFLNSLRKPQGYGWSRGVHGMPAAPGVGGEVILASLSLNVLSVGLPVVILQTYDRVVPNSAMETLIMLIFGLGIVVLLDSVLRYGRTYLTAWSASKFEHAAGCRAVDRLLSANIGRIEAEPPGVHLDRLNAVETLRNFYSGQAKLLMVDLPFVTIFMGLIVIIAGPLAFVPLVMLCFVAIGSLLIGRSLRAALEERAELDDRRYSFIIEVLSAIHTIKGLAFEAAMVRRYERLQESGAGITYRVTFLNNLSQAMGQVFSYATMVAVASVGAMMVMAGGLTVGGLAAATLLAGRTIQPMLRALDFWTQFQNIVVARERATALFDIEPESSPDAVPVKEFHGDIEMRGASFSYSEDAPPLLKDINLTINSGDVIGIKGDMGCGKTTLLMLIMSVLKPDDGVVLFDGVDVSEQTPQSIRRRIAYMPQNATLFNGTIMENLTMFRNRDLEDKALQICRDLGIDVAINRLPSGFETRVGAGAENELSIGLRQGIAMARALVSDSKIILFDEANAAIDSKTDAKLKDTLTALKGQKTMILVSHRPSLLALADRIYEFRDGTLVEEGGRTQIAGKWSVSPMAGPDLQTAGARR